MSCSAIKAGKGEEGAELVLWRSVLTAYWGLASQDMTENGLLMESRELLFSLSLQLIYINISNALLSRIAYGDKPVLTDIQWELWVKKLLDSKIFRYSMKHYKHKLLQLNNRKLKNVLGGLKCCLLHFLSQRFSVYMITSYISFQHIWKCLYFWKPNLFFSLVVIVIIH